MRITLQVPDQYLVDEDAAGLGKRIKLYAALRMFQSGELSTGLLPHLLEEIFVR